MLATVVVMGASLGVIAAFDPATFTGPVTYYALSATPAMVVVRAMVCAAPPRALQQLRQPVRGIVLTLIPVLLGIVAAVVVRGTVGGGVAPNNPILVHYCIFVVICTFLLASAFGGWPFILVRNRWLAGALLLLACYLLGLLAFRILPNYRFLAASPMYVPHIDPGGLFNGWRVLSAFVTGITGVLLLPLIGMWPLVRRPGLMRQPLLGLAWTGICIALGTLVSVVAVGLLGIDPVQFTVHVPIPFMLGALVVLSMLGGPLFPGLRPAARGWANVALALVVGIGLAEIFGLLSPLLSGLLTAGPPAFDYEIWLACALFGVALPLLSLHADYFGYWPLQQRTEDPEPGGAAAPDRQR
jgi:hypothetical protein